jgi:disulfide bond formation protein DsbB
MSTHSKGHGGHHDDHDALGAHVSTMKLLVGILVVLLALTALTVFTAKTWHLGILGNASLAIFIAIVKCSLVCMFFMHLKHDNALYTVVLVTCVSGVVIFLFFSMFDLGTRAFIEPERAHLLTPVPQDMVNKAKYDENELAGRTLFVASCASCHGVNGLGGTGLTGDFKLQESAMVRASSPEQIAAFIIAGRPANSPDSLSGYSMPPKGGNPTLTDAQILQIAQYVKALTADEHADGHDAGHVEHHEPAADGHAQDEHAQPAETAPAEGQAHPAPH